MSCNPSFSSRALGLAAILSVGLLGQPTLAQDDTHNGRVSLEAPDLPPPTVEIDLGQALVRHLLGLGDAALTGVMDGLSDSTNPEAADSVKFIAQQLASSRELGNAAGEVVQEVHIRAWDRLDTGNQPAEAAVRYFNDRLEAQRWESIVRAREQNKMAYVYIQRDGESLRGVFIIAGEGKNLAMINVIGDLSPENVRRLTATATRLGIKLGLDSKLNIAVEKMKREQRD